MTKFYLETGYFEGDTGFRKTEPDQELKSLEGYYHFQASHPTTGGFYLEPTRACYYDPCYGESVAARVRVEGAPGELEQLLQELEA